MNINELYGGFGGKKEEMLALTDRKEVERICYEQGRMIALLAKPQTREKAVAFAWDITHVLDQLKLTHPNSLKLVELLKDHNRWADTKEEFQAHCSHCNDCLSTYLSVGMLFFWEHTHNVDAEEKIKVTSE